MVVSVIEVTPFIERNAVVTFAGTSDFAKAISEVTLAPSGGMVPFKGLKPTAVFNFAQSPTWELTLVYAQDWALATSLSRYLFDNQGKNISLTLNVNDAVTGTTNWAMTVSVAAGSVGGAVDGVATATVTLGVVGAPVPTLIPVALAASDDELELDDDELPTAS
jgi:hypothetical protein